MTIKKSKGNGEQIESDPLPDDNQKGKGEGKNFVAG
jgi:hypothetical protein